MIKRAIDNVIKVLIAFAVALGICALIGCTSTKYVPVETIRIDTLHHYTHRIDSVVKWDSIVQQIEMKGDTVYSTKLVWRNRYISNAVHDTLYINKTDSIRVPYPVEKKLTKWQQFKINMGETMLGVAIVALVAAVILWIILVKRRK